MDPAATEHFFEGNIGLLKELINKTGIVGEWTEDEFLACFGCAFYNGKQCSMTWEKSSKRIDIDGPPEFHKIILSQILIPNSSPNSNDTLATKESNGPSVDEVDYQMKDCNLDRLDLPDRILEGLYLGAEMAAKNLTALKTRSITHILTVGFGLTQAFPEQFVYKKIDAYDDPAQDLSKHFVDCVTFIEEGRKNGGILVHCAAGVSRSSTIVIAYIMSKKGMSFNTAQRFVSDRRWVWPNEGFVEQLKRWEDTLGNKKKGSNL